jgi:diaminohydroxyphosphoribosylaminopyrimidine deaminase/5-amino-6-(5-phosphoribosylamino)uracil reductase
MDGLTGAREIVEELHLRNIQSLIVEGGAAVLADFINHNLWDEARVFTGTSTFGLGIPSPKLTLVPTAHYLIKEDLLEIYTNNE